MRGSRRPGVGFARRDGGAGFGGVRPPLLDLLSGGTFTRASTATYQTGAATIASAAVNERRFEDRGDGQGAAYLSENAATNSCLRSEAVTNAAWVKVNANTTLDEAVAPDGATTADGLLAAAGGIASTAVQILAAPITGPCTLSVWVRRRTAGQTCSISITDGVSTTNLDFTPTTTWTRIAISIASLTTFPTVTLRPHAFAGTATAGDDVYFWGMQVEASRYPTSYIPTTSAAVTRAADVLDFAATTYPDRLRTGRWSIEVCPAWASSEANTDQFAFMGPDGSNFYRVIREAGNLHAHAVTTGVNRAAGTNTTHSRQQWLRYTFDSPLAIITTELATTGSGAGAAGTVWTMPAGTWRFGGVGGFTTLNFQGRLKAPRAA